MATYFNEIERLELQQDDHEAWRAVCGILLTIVSIGVAIACIALVCIL